MVGLSMAPPSWRKAGARAVTLASSSCFTSRAITWYSSPYVSFTTASVRPAASATVDTQVSRQAVSSPHSSAGRSFLYAKGATVLTTFLAETWSVGWSLRWAAARASMAAMSPLVSISAILVVLRGRAMAPPGTLE